MPEFNTPGNDKVLFPATNQTHYCWQKYNEWVLCLRNNKGEEEPCQNARFIAQKLCPNEWIEQWDDQRSNGKFTGIQDVAPEKKH